MASKHIVKERPPAVRSRSRRPPDPSHRAGPLEVMSVNCAALADVEPHALGVTYWFDTPTVGRPFPVRIRLRGRRISVDGKPGPHDVFEIVETIDRVIPGSGPIAVTTRVSDVTPGEWHVTATASTEVRRSHGTRGAPRTVHLASGSSSGVTGFAPVIGVRAPGARAGTWPALVGIGIVVALAVQSALARREDLPATRVLLLSLLASLIGLVGAKLYYLVEQRSVQRGKQAGALTAGLCIQGFVLGAIGTLVLGSLTLGVPAGRVLDVSTPGLLFAMTIGRFGCFFGGCCAGRPTGSRWGLWSSDRRLGMRRIPTQLLESALAFTVGLAALVAVTADVPGGSVFVAGIAAYTLGRQLLFPLRDQPRHTHHGRIVTMRIAAIAVAADVVVMLVA